MQISQRVDGNLLTRQARRRTADGRNRVRPYSFCQLSSYRPIAAPSMWRSSLRTLPMGGQLRRQSRRRLGRRTPETAQRGFDCTQGDERLGLLYRSRDRIDDRYADLIPRAGRLPSTNVGARRRGVEAGDHRQERALTAATRAECRSGVRRATSRPRAVFDEIVDVDEIPHPADEGCRRSARPQD
jgi:hypothetical protein